MTSPTPSSAPPPTGNTRAPTNVEQHNDYQRDYFARVERQTIEPESSDYVARHLDELIRAADLQPGDRILEVGAGKGRFTLQLAARGFDVVATDLSAHLLADLERRDPELRTVAADVCELPQLIEERFDKIIGFFMLHHLPDLPAAFRGMAGVLAPGGSLTFCEPNAWYLPFYLQITFSRKMTWRGDGGVLNMRPGVLAPAMRAAGLEPAEPRSFGFFPPFITNRPVGKRIEEKLEALPLPETTHAFRIFQATDARPREARG